MEKSNKKQKTTYDQHRKMLRKCFGNKLYVLVPYDVWLEYIILNTDVRILCLLASTSKAFLELVESCRRKYFKISLMYRQKNQKLLAHKCLMMCVDNGCPEAMIFLGFYGHIHKIEWSVPEDYKKAVELFKKVAIEYNNYTAMSLYLVWCDAGCDNDDLKKDFEKRLSNQLSDDFAIGYYIYQKTHESKRAFVLIKRSAKSGNEFAMFILARMYYYGFGHTNDHNKSRYWFSKVAELGSEVARRDLNKLF